MPARLLAAACLLAAGACHSTARAGDPFGQPVTLRMQGGPATPDWEITFRTLLPADANDMVSPVAGLLSDAVSACGNFVSAHAGRPLTLSVEVRGGQATAKVAGGAGDGSDCIAGKLRRAPVSLPETDLLVQVLVPSAR